MKERRPRHLSSAAGIAACSFLGVLAAACAQAADGRWTGAIETGFDSFAERYAIADDDTLSSISEFRSRVRLGYALGTVGRDYALVEARGLLGESSYEAGGRVVAGRRFGTAGRHALQLDAEMARRGFRDNSAYEFPNDYLRAYARAGVRWRAGPRVTLRLDDRIEHLDFDRRTEFDYDYTKNAATASADLAGGFTHTVTAGLRLTTMTVPDSSGIEYRSLTPLTEYRAYFDAHRRLQAAMGAERRLYPDDGDRSSFWALLASGSFEWALHPRWSIEIEDEMERYQYDQESSAYANYVQNLADVLLDFNVRSIQVGAGPAFGVLESPSSPEDEYRETGVKVTFEWIGGTGGWLSASYEPGRRDYRLYDTSPAQQTSVSPDAVFSDYGYHRVDFFATVRLRGAFWLNAYANYQPEDHDRAGDDATATAASFTLTYSF